jgi:hypothetical protein
MHTRHAPQPLALFALAAVLFVCARGEFVPPLPARAGPFAAGYDSPSAWLCRPDRRADACRGDLDVTEIRPDGSRVVVPFVPAVAPDVDCFYVYPTVDVNGAPGNHTDFRDTAIMREVTRAQVARFGSTCRLFVPLYRQVTIATYMGPPEELEDRLETAFDDVLDAFQWYRAHMDRGLPIALVGHSQGSDMVVRLLRAVFDDDEAMRARLLVAMAIGTDMQAAEGSTTGGSLRHIPLCTSADELGCVIAFNAFPPEGVPHPWLWPPRAGRTTACVNPASVAGGGKPWLSGAVFPTPTGPAAVGNLPSLRASSRWATTPFVELRDFYRAWCVDGAAGFRYLAVEAAPGPGDTRESPVDLDNPMWRTMLGLHVLDYQFAQGDLMDLVRRKAAVASRRDRARGP